MVAAILDRRDNGIAVKKAQFESWLNTINANKFTKQGEVKGTSLSEEELLTFCNQVLLSAPFVRNVQIRTVPADTKKELINRFKAIEIS